jgi:uncharacterized protein YwgA
MSDPQKLPLVFLLTEDRDAIDGATRFQKLVFLAQEEGGLPNHYSFHADNFGPYSPGLHSDLEALAEQGYIDKNTVRNEVGNEKYVYSLNLKGIREAKSLLKIDQNKPLFDAVAEIKKKYNNKPLQRLLKYVYRSYEEYRTETELDLDRLFDPDARSQFLKKDREFKGTKPGEWKEVNPTAEEFFSVE